jgi:hypothetical protein
LLWRNTSCQKLGFTKSGSGAFILFFSFQSKTGSEALSHYLTIEKALSSNANAIGESAMFFGSFWSIWARLGSFKGLEVSDFLHLLSAKSGQFTKWIGGWLEVLTDLLGRVYGNK